MAWKAFKVAQERFAGQTGHSAIALQSHTKTKRKTQQLFNSKPHLPATKILTYSLQHHCHNKSTA